ncbi:MAG: Transcriptional activator of fatty acid utilization [Chaenotheca gracillima]|nr:MAG: Transcriptional activator of fatty acid utilization [Chaenotheca gracillima]
MASPTSSMPGSFLSDRYRSDHALPPKLDFSIGATSQIFQPPGTPSASSSLYKSTSAVNVDERNSASRSGRKRARQEEPSHEFFTPVGASGQQLEGSWTFAAPGTDFSTAHSTGFTSPVPFVSTKYRLDGGLDTPTAAANAAFERGQSSNYSLDDAYQRNWNSRGAKRYQHVRDHETPHFETDLRRERNGQPRVTITPTDPSKKGWGKSVVHMVGGVAGKVWQFCRENTFAGFYAGGGQGYHMAPLHATSLEDSVWQDESQDRRNDLRLSGTPIPGEFPVARPTEDADASPQRPAKKIQRDKGEGELRGHWVMVSADTTPQLRELSPSRNNVSRKSASSASGRLYSTPTGRTGPTRMGKRSGVTPSRASQVSLSGSPAVRSAHAASYASPRSPSASPRRKTTQSTLPTDPQKIAAKRRREEKQVNASMEKFNDQLRAMIREGKEALGSTIDVEDGDDGMEMDDER